MSSSDDPRTGADAAAGGGREGDASAPGPFRSFEARWFFTGAPPEAVVRALFGDGAPAAPGDGGHPPPGTPGWSRPRTDRYLVFSPEMGVKLRDEPGRPVLLEFKGRLAPPVETRFGAAGVGLSDTWAKWSLPAAGVPEGLQSAVRTGQQVLSVTKTRLLTVLALEDDGAITPLDPGSDVRVARGVQLELSRVATGPADESSGPAGTDAARPPGSPGLPDGAWSVSFEAFPLEPGLVERVMPVVTEWLTRGARAGLRLELDDSAAYPAWLLGRLPPG